MVFDEQGIPAVALESFLPTAEDLFQFHDIEIGIRLGIPQSKMFELEDHVHLPFLLPDPKTCLICAYAIGFAYRQHIIVRIGLFFEFLEEGVDPLLVHMHIE